MNALIVGHNVVQVEIESQLAKVIPIFYITLYVPMFHIIIIIYNHAQKMKLLYYPTIPKSRENIS